MVAYDARPMKRRITDDLRAQIAAGTLTAGDPLPSEVDLAAAWSVARMTARGALLELEQAGLITPGRPRRVARHDRLVVHVTRAADRTSPGESPTDGADSWLADMDGREPAQQITVTTEVAPAEAAKRLGTPGDETAIARQLVRTIAGGPHNLITFWFPGHIAGGTPLASPASITEGSVAWLEKHWAPLEHEVEMSARMPTPVEETQLRIPAGIPVLIVWRASYSLSAHGRPLVASQAVYPADRTTLRLSL